jgi:hypothetical protein
LLPASNAKHREPAHGHNGRLAAGDGIAQSSSLTDGKSEDVADPAGKRVNFPMPSSIDRAEYLADFGRAKYVIGLMGSDGESEDGGL